MLRKQRKMLIQSLLESPQLSTLWLHLFLSSTDDITDKMSMVNVIVKYYIHDDLEVVVSSCVKT